MIKRLLMGGGLLLFLIVGALRDEKHKVAFEPWNHPWVALSIAVMMYVAYQGILLSRQSDRRAEHKWLTQEEWEVVEALRKDKDD